MDEAAKFCCLLRLEDGFLQLHFRQLSVFSEVLAGFVCQLDTSWGYHRERNLPGGNASMRYSCKAFSELVIKEGDGPAHCGWCHPWAGGPGFYMKAS